MEAAERVFTRFFAPGDTQMRTRLSASGLSSPRTSARLPPRMTIGGKPRPTGETCDERFFLFDNVHIKDFAKLEDYAQKAAPLVERFGGRYRVIGGKTIVLKGTGRPPNP